MPASNSGPTRENPATHLGGQVPASLGGWPALGATGGCAPLLAMHKAEGGLCSGSSGKELSCRVSCTHFTPAAPDRTAAHGLEGSTHLPGFLCVSVIPTRGLSRSEFAGEKESTSSGS